MRRVLLLIVVLCLLGPQPALSAKKKPATQLHVKAALVTNYPSGKVLYSQDPDRRIAPASVTKIMTMYLVFDALASGKAHLTDRIKVSRRADGTGGSSMGLLTGETVTLDELMRGMAVASGNDACIAIAEHFGGIRHFVAMMNRKARALGMTRTHFQNPNGLPARGQLTTARDLTKLACSYLRHYPQALRYHSTLEINHRGSMHHNTNHLLGVVDGVDGIKTGFVCSSGFNIVATAKRGKTRIIAVVLGGRTKQIRNHETTRVLNAAFTGGNVRSVLAANTGKPAPQHNTVATRRHRGKKLHMASRNRHRSISASRGASARFDASNVRTSRHHRKTTSHTKSKRSSTKHHKKNRTTHP